MSNKDGDDVDGVVAATAVAADSEDGPTRIGCGPHKVDNVFLAIVESFCCRDTDCDDAFGSSILVAESLPVGPLLLLLMLRCCYCCWDVPVFFVQRRAVECMDVDDALLLFSRF